MFTVLLTSRRFWTLALALLVFVVQSFVPSFHLDSEQAAALVILVVSYLLGVAVDPGAAGWRGVLRSRKFWAALIGLMVIVLEGFGVAQPFALTSEQLVMMAAALGGYIASIALEAPRRGWNQTHF